MTSIATLRRNTRSPKAPAQPAEPTLRLMQALARYIDKNAGSTISLRQLAAQAQLSPTHLQRTFKAVLGVSPKAYHDAARLRLLKNGLKAGKSVLDSITEAGFQSTSRLYGHPLRSLGMTPSTYRAGGTGETIAYAVRASALGPLLMAATGASLELRKLQVYPIPDAQLFAIEVMLRVTAAVEMLFITTGLAGGILWNPAIPKWTALALAPFDHNIGSASAMLGFLQIGVSSIASASIGLFDSHSVLPVVVILATTSWIGLAILVVGRRKLSQLRFVEEKGATPLAH